MELPREIITKSGIRYEHNTIYGPVRAGGVIIYSYKSGHIKLLLQQKNSRFEDMGGKIDKDDIDINATISREMFEEFKIIPLSKCIELINGPHDTIYIPNGKYLLYLIENKEISDIPLKAYGKYEDGKARTIHWVNSMGHKNIFLHPRLHIIRKQLTDFFTEKTDSYMIHQMSQIKID